MEKYEEKYFKNVTLIVISFKRRNFIIFLLLNSAVITILPPPFYCWQNYQH